MTVPLYIIMMMECLVVLLCYLNVLSRKKVQSSDNIIVYVVYKKKKKLFNFIQHNVTMSRTNILKISSLAFQKIDSFGNGISFYKNQIISMNSMIMDMQLNKIVFFVCRLGIIPIFTLLGSSSTQKLNIQNLKFELMNKFGKKIVIYCKR